MSSCFYRHCSDAVLFKCTCENEGVYICANHLGHHVAAKSSKTHSYQTLMHPIVHLNKQALIKKLSESLSSISKLKENIIYEATIAIQELNKKYKMALDDLSNAFKILSYELDKIIKIEAVNIESKDFIENLLVRDDQSYIEKINRLDVSYFLTKNDPKFDLKTIKMPGLVNSINSIVLSKNKPSSEYFSYIRISKGKNYVHSINTLTNQIIKYEIELDCIKSPCCCNIPGNLLFVGGGRVNEEYSKKYFLLDISSNHILFETSYQELDIFCGNLFFELNVYYFCKKVNTNIMNYCCKYNFLFDT